MQLLTRLDALGDHAQAERSPELDDRSRQDGTGFLGHRSDQHAVELDDVEREVRQQGEGRVARAEAAEGDVHAEGTETGDDGGGRSVEHEPPGDLEHEPVRPEGVCCEQLLHVVDETIRDLWCGQVDRQVDRLRPFGEIGARRREHPAPDRTDQSGVLGDADELEVRHDPPLGVTPAQQRFEPDDALALEVDERLVVQLELVQGEGVSQVVLDGEPLGQPVAPPRVEHLEAPAARKCGREQPQSALLVHTPEQAAAVRRAHDPVIDDRAMRMRRRFGEARTPSLFLRSGRRAGCRRSWSVSTHRRGSR